MRVGCSLCDYELLPGEQKRDNVFMLITCPKCKGTKGIYNMGIGELRRVQLETKDESLSFLNNVGSVRFINVPHIRNVFAHLETVVTKEEEIKAKKIKAETNRFIGKCQHEDLPSPEPLIQAVKDIMAAPVEELKPDTRWVDSYLANSSYWTEFSNNVRATNNNLYNFSYALQRLSSTPGTEIHPPRRTDPVPPPIQNRHEVPAPAPTPTRETRAERAARRAQSYREHVESIVGDGRDPFRRR